MLEAQSCATICNPMDGSPPGSSVHGILLARILEWVAMSFSRGSPGIETLSLMLPGRWVLYQEHHLGTSNRFIIKDSVTMVELVSPREADKKARLW